MQANELRIGNWITSKSSRIPFQVTIEDFVFILENIEHYEPIPLTEEWLLKFGFRIVNNGHRSKNRKIYLYKENYIFEYWGLFFDCEDRVEIKHIHTLQNLYFALTGEELEIKP